MKALLLVTCLFASLPAFGMPKGVNTPLGSIGQQVEDFSFVGSSFAYVVSTGVVSVSPAILYGVILDSAAVGDGYRIFDASCTTAGDNDHCRGALQICTVRSESATLPTYRAFTLPIRTNRGISVYGPAGNPDLKATILYDIR